MVASIDTHPRELPVQQTEASVPALPGTTIPADSQQPPPASRSTDDACHPFPGPIIDGKATTVTRYEPQQLINSSLLQSIFTLTNDAYSESHAKSSTLPHSSKRLDDPDAFVRGLGFDAGTFCFIPGLRSRAGPGSGKKGTTFVRVQLPDKIGPDAEIWELKSLAVDVRLQGRGLAGYLMRSVDEEVLRRFSQAPSGEQLWMVLTTMKEANFEFYRRKGYVSDYENVYAKGYMESETGFTVVHMSRRLA
ncbi:hypothetical protein Tdes44962_MAKER01751 [Teratosphaeria destructans]|uniref:N-acetyltransferase domain-containing protein n=1 Tax=Teratosphaeria destructans TaxID=418781 RepID=A0A9W7SXC7_9PEZI|nr:hypothetical protein Tdes44962_MAKER01751 [Teratosphaeria destructans]